MVTPDDHLLLNQITPAKKWIDFILGSPSTQSILLFVYPFNISSWVSKWQTSTSIPLYSMPEFPYLSFNLSVTEFSRFQSTLKNPYLHDDMHWLHFQLHLIHVIFFFTNWIHGRRLSLIWTASSNLKKKIFVYYKKYKVTKRDHKYVHVHNIFPQIYLWSLMTWNKISFLFILES